MTGTNPFEDAESQEDVSVLYPRHKDPFVKRTKSVKKMKKAEKKAIKKEKKQQKIAEKSKKSQENHSNVNNNGKSIRKNGKKEAKLEIEIKNGKISSERPINSSSTLPSPKSPQEKIEMTFKPGYQTLDSRSQSATHKMSPILPNKRVAQLKTGTSHPRHIPIPQMESGIKKQTYAPSIAKSDNDTTNVIRPMTLDLKTKTDTLSTIPESHRTPSPLLTNDNLNDEVMRRHRTESISKQMKEKKKKKRKLKIKLKKNKKSRGKETSILEDKDTMNQVKMRHSENQRLLQLQKQVSETEDIMRKNVITLVNQRNSQLETLLLNSEVVEKSAYAFAEVSTENRLKQQARNTCCGIGSKYRFCWYVCACTTGVKRKKKSVAIPKSPEESKVLSPRAAADLIGDTNDDCYKSTTSPIKMRSPKKTPNQERPASTSHAVPENRFSGTITSITNRLSQISVTIRGSMPSLTKKESPDLAESRRNESSSLLKRKSSSASSVPDQVKKSTNKRQAAREKKEKEERETQYRLHAGALFEDEETRGRAISLLRMDG